MNKESTRPKAKKPKFSRGLVIVAIVLAAIIVLVIVLSAVTVLVIIPKLTSTDNVLGGSFCVSPDSTTVVFSYMKVKNMGDATGSLFAQDLRTGAAVRLTDTDSQLHSRPEYSPNGAKILYLCENVASDPPSRHLWMMDRDGGNQTQLTSGKTFVQHAIFSNDPAYAYLALTDQYSYDKLYDTYDLKDFRLYRLDVATLQMSQLSSLTYTALTDRLSLTSDGRTLLWGTFMDSVYSLDLATNATTQAPVPGKGIAMPQISPDGKTFAYIAPGEGGAAVAVYDLANKTGKTLTKISGGGVWPSFMGNGSKVMFMEEASSGGGRSDYTIGYVDVLSLSVTSVELDPKIDSL